MATKTQWAIMLANLAMLIVCTLTVPIGMITFTAVFIMKLTNHLDWYWPNVFIPLLAVIVAFIYVIISRLYILPWLDEV